jgi:phosphopantothenoylcysteine decarboxylase
LTSVFRAWDFAKPLIVAPAMNTLMWTNPWTRRHLDLLEQFLPSGQFCVLSPIVKTLACGEDGLGAMAEVNAIVRNVNGRFR